MQFIVPHLPPAPQTVPVTVLRSSYATPVKDAAMHLAASACWGAAGRVSMPLAALMPPLWIVPLYCGYKSARQLGKAVCDSAVSLSRDPDPEVPDWGRIARRASSLHARRRYAEAAAVLSAFSGHLEHIEPSSVAGEMRTLYQRSMEAYLGEQVSTMQTQRLLGALLEADDEPQFLHHFAALAPAQQATAACMCGHSESSLHLLRIAINNDAADAFALLIAALPAADEKFSIWRAEILMWVRDNEELFQHSMAQGRPRMAMHCIGNGAGEAQLFIQSFPQQTVLITALVQQERCSAIDAIHWSASGELALDFILTERVELADVVELRNHRLTQQVSDAFGQDAAGAERLCAVGALSLEQALSLGECGILTPQIIVNHFAVSEPTGREWWAAGLISLQAYVAAQTSAWNDHEPLTPEQLQWVHNFAAMQTNGAPSDRLNDLWGKFPQTIFRTPSTRRSFLIRLTAVYLSADSAATVQSTDVSHECTVCFEPLTSERLGVRSEHCQHSASICAHCSSLHATLNLTRVCAAPRCTAQLSPNELMTMGVGANAIDLICGAAIKHQLATVPHWRPCESDGCLGGQSVAPGTDVPYSCPCCGRQQVLTVRTVDREIDLEFVGRLIESLDDSSDMNSVIRECYACGSATQHREACAHMTCSSCSLDWDFNYGSQNAGRGHTTIYELLPQTYVPKAGLLLDAGLYDGLDPGSVEHRGYAVRDHVRLRAQELGIQWSPQASDET